MGRRLMSLRVKFGDWRKCHALVCEGQGRSSLTRVEARGATAAGGAFSDG